MIYNITAIIPFNPYAPALPAVEGRDIAIRNAAIRSLLEVSTAWGMNVLVEESLPREASVFGSALLGVNVCNLMFTALTVYLVAQTTLHLARGENSPHRNIWEMLHASLDGKAHALSLFSLVNLLHIAGPHFLIHEGGHALMALSCFVDAHPKITIYPFKRGSTTYAISHGLTTFGRLLGKEKALLFVAAAGIAASVTAALVEMGIAHHFQETHPRMSEVIESFAYAQLFNDILYGLLALGPARHHLTHDFVELWEEADIHPLVSIGVMVALPLFQKWALSRPAVQPQP